MRSKKKCRVIKGTSFLFAAALASVSCFTVRPAFGCGGAPGVYVHAGGSPYIDAGQNVWAADSGFIGGTFAATNDPIKGTEAQGLFQTAHVGRSFDFIANVGNGGYTLTLMFAEPVMTKPGQRVFNVSAQGKEILKNFDPLATAGPRTAITRSFPVKVTDGELDLDFQGVVGEALISAIQLVPLPTPSAQPSDLSAAADSPTSVTLNWTNNANNETGFEIERTIDGKNDWQNIGAQGVDAQTFHDTTVQPSLTYDYRIQSFGQNGASPFTSPATVKTPDAPSNPVTLATAAPAAATDIRIDVGSSSNYKDSTGNVWLADTGSSGGEERLFTYPIANTADPVLYQTFRTGNFSYALPADNGSYTLKLYFEDPVSTGKNQRLFDVTAEGKQILTNFDIFAAAGYRKPAIESFPVTVTDNELTLAFKTVEENSILSAIELVPTATQTSAPSAPSKLTAMGVTAGVDLTWVDNSDNESGFEIDRESPGSTTFAKIATVPPNQTTYPDTELTAGDTYTYEVRAINNAGDSAFSNTASAAPITTTAPSSNFTKITWAKVANSPVARTEAETAVVNGKQYCFGGYTDSTLVPEAVADVYNPTTNTWSPIASMPTGETHAGTCTDGTRYIYMAGGYTGPGGGGNQTFATTNVFIYDTVTNTWFNLPGLPQSRGAGGLVLLGSTLHFFGGTDLARKDVNTHWTLNLNDLSAGWQTAASLPTVRNHMGAVVLNGKIYAIGGQQHQDAAEIAQSAVQIWDPASPNAWTEGAPLPLARSHIAGATFVMGGRIIVLGGETTYLHSVDNDSAYDPSTNTWITLTPLWIPRSSGCANQINGNMYYMTGNISEACYKGIPG